MKRIIFSSILVLTLLGCSSLDIVDAVNPFKEDKGIEATVQLGKTNTQIQTDNKSLVSLNDKTDINTTTSSNNKANVVNQSMNTSSDKSAMSTKVDTKTTNDNKAETINQDTKTVTNNNNNIPGWIIWAFGIAMSFGIPSPIFYFSNKREKKLREEHLQEVKAERDHLREVLGGKLKKINKESSSPTLA